MRALFIRTIVVFSLYGCGSNHNHSHTSIVKISPSLIDVLAVVIRGEVDRMKDKTVDFRYPIYIVPDKSFWSGCQDPSIANGKICRSSRMAAIKDGTNEWLRYFPKNTRPVVSIVEKQDLPAKPKNHPIYLMVDHSGCKEAEIPKDLILLACYKSSSEIVFIKSDNITSRLVAHELGHAFGIDHTVLLNPDGSHTIMSEPIKSDYVTFIDILFLCGRHPEVKCPLPTKALGDGNLKSELQEKNNEQSVLSNTAETNIECR